MEELNIVDLIENNPITKLSNNYNSKLIEKVKKNFTNYEQQLFLSSFYCYLNYHSTNDFVIDLDNVWQWLGFGQKVNAKRVLEKNFIIDKDYKLLLCHVAKQTTSTKGGHNKETFMLNIKTFKSMCLKSGTKKADEIHDYFIKLEEFLQEALIEESAELKLQLESQLESQQMIIANIEKDKIDIREKTLLEQFPLNTQCVYYGLIDNKSLGKPGSKMYHEDLIKFGQSNNLVERVKCHKKTFNNFRLVAAFKVKNKIEIENAIKRHAILEKRIRSLMIDDINHRELLALDDADFTIDKVDNYIREIIKQNEYNVENYNLLLEKNRLLDEEICKLKTELKERETKHQKALKELQNYKPDITTETQKGIASNYTICKYGYYLYAFECENMRYKCSISRQKDFEKLTTNLKGLDTDGVMKYYTKVSYAFSEKIMMFLLKEKLTLLGNNKFEGTFEDVKKIIDITVKLEDVLVKNANDLDNLLNVLDNNTQTQVINTNEEDPETPIVRKSKRSIDQINKDTGKVVCTYESIEAAGRSLGLTTGTAIGIALREKRVCKGFIWRYSGVSKEDQYSEQPVIKICCSNGINTHFKTIADAAKDSNVSAPALRQRVLTNVHINGHHWIFDKSASHYV